MEVHEMNGRTMRQVARSVQLAVMAAPETSIVEAAVEARRRHSAVSGWSGTPAAPTVRPLAPAGA